MFVTYLIYELQYSDRQTDKHYSDTNSVPFNDYTEL